MAFFGFFNVYALRVNLSVAIVAMTEKINVTLDNGTVVETQEFDWTSTQQGVILSSFFYGYILTQFAGGLLANKLGGHRVSEGREREILEHSLIYFFYFSSLGMALD